MRTMRRARGALLRLIRNRPLALALGLALAAPGWLLIAYDFSWETWLTDGVSLVLLATGLALAVSAISGRKADWIDPSSPADGSSRGSAD